MPVKLRKRTKFVVIKRRKKKYGRGTTSSKVVPQAVIDRLQQNENEIIAIKHRIRVGGLTPNIKKALQAKLDMLMKERLYLIAGHIF
jgi:hypothetical protein